MSFFGASYFGGGSTIIGGGTIIDSSGSIVTTVGSTKAIEITCNQTVTLLTLLFVTETSIGLDVATVPNGSITKSGTMATLSLTSPMTSTERTLRWSLVNIANGEAVAAGLMFITYDAQGDT